jgi:hypothetical protein
LKYSVPMKKHWVNPDCQNSEPTKRTVSISAIDRGSPNGKNESHLEMDICCHYKFCHNKINCLGLSLTPLLLISGSFDNEN